MISGVFIACLRGLWDRICIVRESYVTYFLWLCSLLHVLIMILSLPSGRTSYFVSTYRQGDKKTERGDVSRLRPRYKTAMVTLRGRERLGDEVVHSLVLQSGTVTVISCLHTDQRHKLDTDVFTTVLGSEGDSS